MTRAPAGAASNRSRRFRREHPLGFLLRRGPQPHPQVDIEMDLDLGAPRPPRGLHQPFVAGAALVGNREALHDLQFIRADRGRRSGDRLGQHLQVENPLFLAAEHGKDTVRRQFGQRFAEIEIILEFFAFGLLAAAHGRSHQPVRPHLLAQAPDQVGILGEALDQNRTRALERGRGIGHLLVGIDERDGHGLRIVLRLRQQQIRQRLQPRLLGDLGLGSALRLEREINVFQTPLAVGRQNGRFERGIQLALLTNGIEDRNTAFLQLAQIIQALLQRAQLRIVERAGSFLAVSRNERNRGAAVEQRHRRLDLLFANAEFFRDLPIDICHVRSF